MAITRMLVVLAVGVIATGCSAPAPRPSDIIPVSVSPTPSSRPASSATTFHTVDPWHDGTAANAITGTAGPGSGCTSSELAPRRDGYRCFIDHLIYDPCFTDGTDYLCVPSTLSGAWTKFAGVPRDSSFANTGAPGSTDIFAVQLANGAECIRRSGSFPPGPPDYPYTVGGCRGGPFGSDGGAWRIGDGMDSAKNYPLYPTNDPSVWAVAVETSAGKVERLPVANAWR